MVTRLWKCTLLCARRCSLVDWCISGGYFRQTARLSTGSSETDIQQRLPISKKEQKRMVRNRPQSDSDQRRLSVAIIGAPNAGKSTLLNQLIGWKVAPVSQKVHTTRCKTLGVLTEDKKQVVFLDTPGIIVPGKLKRHKLETSLLVDPHIAMYSADIVLVIVDASRIWHQTRLDPEILRLLQLHASTPSILVLNKVDRLKRKQGLLNIARKLTDGIVANNVNWSTVKTSQKNRPTYLLNKLSRENKTHDVTSNSPEVYSLEESCSRLQSSYEELYNDSDSDESELVETGLRASDEEVSSKIPADIADGPLNWSSVPNSGTSLSDISDNKGVGANRDSTLLTAPTDAVGGRLEESCTANNSDSTNTVKDVGTVLDDRTFSCDEDCNKPLTSQDGVDLYAPEAWELYYSHLQEIGSEMKDREGWPKFDAVFMISAVDGDGVADVKNYLLDKTYAAGWAYSSSTVTDQNPVKLATSIIRERLLDHLPDEIPYSIQVKMSLWTVENNYLRTSFDIVCPKNRQMRHVLQHIRAISAEAKQELMNAFRREMTLQLVAISLDKSSSDVHRRLRRQKATPPKQSGPATTVK